MSTSTVTNPERLRFNRRLLFPGGQGALGLEVPAAGDPEIVAALRRNDPFPERDVVLGTVELKGDGGRDFAFSAGDSKVTFKGSGSAFAGLGVYGDPGAALAALRFEDSIERGLRLETETGQRFLLLQWGYDATAAAKGSLALGYGANATFGVDARSEGVFAVLRRIRVDAPALHALETAVSNWRLPRQVESPEDLEPGTWIIAEVDGGIGLTLGTRFGYDFNWSRETALGGLKEDIGLRLQLGVNAALGLEASGKYAVVVSRPSEAQKVRLQVLKQRKKGLSFAFNAAAEVRADFSNLPPGADDFVKAVFDVHGAQIIDDLHAIEKWTDPDTKLSGPLAGLSVDYAKKLLADITGMQDLDARFDEARGRVVELLKVWDNLPHRISTVVYKLVEQNRSEELGIVRALCAAIAEGSTAKLQSLIGGELRKAEFFSTPAGRFLESIATEGVMSLLTQSAELQRVRPAAEAAAKLLDPAGLERTLRGLQSALLERLDLDRFADPAKIPDAQSLDAWMKLKISEFLGRPVDSNQQIQEARAAISTLLAKRGQFYQKAKAALTRPYEARFAAAYSKATADSALIDAEFEFDRDSEAAGRLLGAALRGDFNALFTTESPAVQLNQAVLSHGITRVSHVEISLPKYDRTADHLNEALARVEAVQDGERLLVYDLEAGDTVVERNRRNSRLAVAAHLDAAKGTGVRIHNKEAFTYSYSFRQAVRNMKSSHLRHQVRPYLEQYFGSLFSAEAPIGVWISDLDKQIDRIEFNGTDNFGHTLLALELSLPAAAAASWLNAPRDKKARQYQEMSCRIQAALKRVTSFYYFDDPAKYRDLGAAAPLLVYAAILPVARNSLLHWNYEDREILRQMILDQRTLDALARSLQRAHDALVDAGFARDAGSYEEGQLSAFCRSAMNGPGNALLRSLLFVEAEIIKQAHSAGLAVAEFREDGWRDPGSAVKALADFGSAITDAFNRKVSGVYGGGALRPLGTMLFVEAAGAFSGGAAVKPAALFELTVVKQKAGFELSRFVDPREPQAPGREDVVIQERLVAV